MLVRRHWLGIWYGSNLFSLQADLNVTFAPSLATTAVPFLVVVSMLVPYIHYCLQLKFQVGHAHHYYYIPCILTMEISPLRVKLLSSLSSSLYSTLTLLRSDLTWKLAHLEHCLSSLFISTKTNKTKVGLSKFRIGVFKGRGREG